MSRRRGVFDILREQLRRGVDGLTVGERVWYEKANNKISHASRSLGKGIDNFDQRRHDGKAPVKNASKSILMKMADTIESIFSTKRRNKK